MFERIPSDVVFTYILQKCSIDVRVAIGVPPHRLDMHHFETGELGEAFERRCSATHIILPTITYVCVPIVGTVKYEYDSCRTMLVPGSTFVRVQKGGLTVARFWITTEGRIIYGVTPRKVNALDVVPFDLTMLPRNAKIACIGKRGSGKTTLAMDIVRERDISLVVSPRRSRTRYMAFERFLNARQDLAIEQMPRAGAVVLEGGVYDWWNPRSNTRFHEIMYNPDVMVVSCMQHPVRQSERFDHVFAFHHTSALYRARLWTSFMKDRFESREDFEAAFDRCAPGRHDCMVVADGRLGTYRAPRLRFGDGESIVVSGFGRARAALRRMWHKSLISLLEGKQRWTLTSSSTRACGSTIAHNASQIPRTTSSSTSTLRTTRR